MEFLQARYRAVSPKLLSDPFLFWLYSPYPLSVREVSSWARLLQMNLSKQVYSVVYTSPPLLLLLRWNPIQRGIQAMPSNVIQLLELTFLLSFCQTPSLLPLNCATPSSLMSRKVGERGRGGRGEDGCQGLASRSQPPPYSQISTLMRHLLRQLKMTIMESGFSAKAGGPKFY